MKMVKKKKEEQIKAVELLKEEEKLEKAANADMKNLKISESKQSASILSGYDATDDSDIVFK